MITLFTKAKTWKQPKCPSSNEWIKMWYAHMMEYHSTIEKSEIMPFAAIRMDLEMSEVLNKTAKDKYHIISLMWNLKKWYKWIYLQTDPQNKLKGKGGRDELEINRYTLQFSRSVVPDSLWPHGLQHARPPCPSPTPRVHPNSCPLSQWCHPTISSSIVPFSCLQSFPASGSFPMSQLFKSGGQSTGASASTSVLPVNIQDWFPLGWTG